MLLPLLQEKLVANRVKEIVLTSKDLLIDPAIQFLDLSFERLYILCSCHIFEIYFHNRPTSYVCRVYVNERSPCKCGYQNDMLTILCLWCLAKPPDKSGGFVDISLDIQNKQCIRTPYFSKWHTSRKHNFITSLGNLLFTDVFRNLLRERIDVF